MREKRLIECRGLVLCGVLAGVVLAGSVPVAGQAPQAAKGTAMRTPWGDPDMRGIWDARLRVPYQRSKNEKREFFTDAEVAAKEKSANQREKTKQELIDRGEYVAIGDRYFPVDPGIFRDGGGGVDREIKVSKRTSAIIDPPIGRLPPWTPEQMKRFEAFELAQRGRGETDSWEDRPLGERCITKFSPASAPNVQSAQLSLGERFDGGAESRDADGSVGAPIRRIMQFPGYVAITTLEIGHAGEGSYRIIPLDKRPALGSSIRQWQGESRGHFEGGDTLVIEISNFNDKQNVPGTTGDTLRVTERYRRVNADTMEYTVTVNDPGTYIRPYTVQRELARDDSYEMQPFGCHEGHRSIAGALSQARADENSALEYGLEVQEGRRERYELLKKEWAELWPEWKQNAR